MRVPHESEHYQRGMPSGDLMRRHTARALSPSAGTSIPHFRSFEDRESSSIRFCAARCRNHHAQKPVPQSKRHHPSLVSIRKLRMRNNWFPIRKGGIFDSTLRSPPSDRLRGPTRDARCRPGQEIKELRGGVLRSRRTISLAKLDREGARRVRPTAEVTSKPED